jgi:hypothetical protein
MHNNKNSVIATLDVAFYSLQNAATQLTVASILAAQGSGLRVELDVLAGAVEQQAAALAAVLDRCAGLDAA